MSNTGKKKQSKFKNRGNGGDIIPNNVINIVEFHGDAQQLETMLNAIKNDEYGFGSVDFNKIIPMPESLNISAGSATDKALTLYKEFVEVFTLGGTMNMDRLSDIPLRSEEVFLKQRQDISREDWELGKAAWNNLREYGASTWYSWRINNWGTKWNAYSCGMEFCEGDCAKVFFETAWSAPHPILEKLSETYPDIGIEHEWADEDIGVNCGRFSYANGERTEEYFPESGREAIDFACSLWGLDVDEFFAERNNEEMMNLT